MAVAILLAALPAGAQVSLEPEVRPVEQAVSRAAESALRQQRQANWQADPSGLCPSGWTARMAVDGGTLDCVQEPTPVAPVDH